MPNAPKKKSVLAEARSWATKRKLFGTQAFLKYVILRFTENLNRVSDEVIFKGGNLLWVYIGTPRATVDLDLATLKINSHTRARQLIEKACEHDSEIEFSLHSFKEVEQEGKLGAALTIAYRTEQGASNRFEVDLVYALSTDAHEIASPVHPEVKIRSATIENIIVDKVSACQRFGSGNSRMKDFDDLWRLSVSSVEINVERLRTLLRTRKVEFALDSVWINPEMEQLWARHRKRYKDLPERLDLLFFRVNDWFRELGV
jgi:hypothetical protein